MTHYARCASRSTSRRCGARLRLLYEARTSWRWTASSFLRWISIIQYMYVHKFTALLLCISLLVLWTHVRLSPHCITCFLFTWRAIFFDLLFLSCWLLVSQSLISCSCPSKAVKKEQKLCRINPESGFDSKYAYKLNNEKWTNTVRCLFLLNYFEMLYDTCWACCTCMAVWF